MEQSTGSVVKIRPAQLELAVPSFQPTVVSSASNIFQQEVLAQSYSQERISWNLRSPSSQLLCSPLLFGVMRIKLTCPYKLCKSQQIGPLLGYYDTEVDYAASAPAAPAAALDMTARGGYGYRPMFCFSSGNGVMNACESKSISVNGGTWSALNENLYLRSLDECYVPRDAQQRAYSTCGGCKNANDSVPVSGHVLGLPDSMGISARTHAVGAITTSNSLLTVGHGAAADRALDAGFRPSEGATMDSGLTRRMHNFYDQIIDVQGDADTGRTYTIEIKFPISGSVFNDLWGAQGLARSDPRLRMALGLPHVNQLQVVLQFKDLFKTLIRRLGRPNQVGPANILAGAVSNVVSDVQIEFDSSYPPRLRATYIRLPAFRSYPETSVLQICRREIRRAEGTRAKGDYGGKGFCDALFGGTGAAQAVVNGLRCAGDFFSLPSAQVVRPPRRDAAGHTKIIKWTGVQFPQPPSYLFFVYQKSPEFMQYDNPLKAAIDRVAEPGDGADRQAYDAKWGSAAALRQVFDTVDHTNLAVKTTIGARAAGHARDTYGIGGTFNQEIAARNIAQSQDSQAAILQFECVIQSAVGSFAFRDSENQTQNTHTQDRDRLWRTHVRNCHSSYSSAGRGVWQDRESCLLLSASDYLVGLQTSPGTVFPITLDIRIKFANRASYSGGACYTTGCGVKGKMEFEDFIVGEPIMVGCFHQNVMSIAASSSVLSSQAFSQATTAAALSST